MKRTLAALVVIAANFAAPVLHAGENSAREQTCEFVSVAIEDGSTAGIEKLSQMFSWRESAVKTVKDSIAVLAQFEFIAGNIYLVADFDGLAEQHLVVLSTKSSGAMFLLIDFERHLGKLVPVHFKFKDKYRELIEEIGTLSLEPRKIDC